MPLLSKHVTAELGNITPYIIVPGEWSDRDIEYHATNVASGLAQNTGHNCIAAEVCRAPWHAADSACTWPTLFFVFFCGT